MAGLSVPPKKDGTNTLRTQDEEESRATKHSGGVEKDNINNSASTSKNAVAGSDTCGTLRFEDPERQKNRKRGYTRRESSVLADTDSRSVCDSPAANNRPRRGDSPLCSVAGGSHSKSVTADRNGRTCQRSSVRVGTSSSASCVTADTIEYTSQESSSESSSGDEVDEIDLRAKTEEELYRHGEHVENTEDDEFSKDNECAVQASFGLFDPNERDEEAICRLLRQSALASSLRFSPCELLRLAAAVAQQGNVGSVLKTIDDEELEEEEEKRHKAPKCGSHSTGNCAGERRNGSRRGGSASSATSAAAGTQHGTESAGKSTQETEGREEEQECGTVVGFLTLLSCKQYPDVVAPFKNAVLRLARRTPDVLTENDVIDFSINCAASLLILFGTAWTAHSVGCPHFSSGGIRRAQSLPNSSSCARRAEQYSREAAERSAICVLLLPYCSKHASAEQRRTVERIFLTSVREDQNEASKSQSNTRGSDSRSACQNRSAELGESGDGAVNCGWLLKERLSNTPPQLIPQMYESLLEDISWSLSTDEMDEAERPFYAYTHVCGLTRVYKARNVRDQWGKRHKARSALRGRSLWLSTEEAEYLCAVPLSAFDAIYLHPEDEILVELSSLAFAWPTGLSVRITVEKDRVNASSADAATEYDQTSSRSRFRSCPEYVLFYALPFEQFRRCKDAITVRAREGTVGCAAE